MLDYRTKRPMTNYFGQAQQLRLLSLVVLSGLVLWAMTRSSEPGAWRWLLLTDAHRQSDAGPDTRLAQAPAAAEPPDAFVAPAQPAEPPADEDPEKSHRGPLFPGVRTDYLSTVRDDTVLRGSESDAWYHLLAVLAKADPQELARASLGRVSFVQLFKQTNEYRGRLVTVHGTVRRAQHFEAGKNSFDVQGYYQLWLEPADGPASPIVLYALELPAGFPQGLQVAAEVSATGFFFKRWAYQAQDAIRTAPLVLVRTVAWTPPPPAPQPPPVRQIVPYVLGTLALGAALVAVLWLSGRRAGARTVANLPGAVDAARLGELAEHDASNETPSESNPS